MTRDMTFDQFDDDLPRVQIPLGRDLAGLTIDGDFKPLPQLPREARRAYTRYAKQGGSVRVWQCDTCGYLTNAKALRRSERATYTCSGCGGRTASVGLQRSASSSFTQVHGPHVEPDDERHVDVLSVVSEEKCPEDHGPAVESESGFRPEGDEEAVECPKCVPNHPSHLGKLQNKVGGRIETDEMLQIVAEAVQHEREV